MGAIQLWPSFEKGRETTDQDDHMLLASTATASRKMLERIVLENTEFTTCAATLRRPRGRGVVQNVLYAGTKPGPVYPEYASACEYPVGRELNGVVRRPPPIEVEMTAAGAGRVAHHSKRKNGSRQKVPHAES